MYIYIYIYKMAQLFVGHNFQTAQENFTKLHSTLSQHVFNHIANFQSYWTTDLEMAYHCDKEMPSFQWCQIVINITVNKV